MYSFPWASLVTQMVKNLPVMQETWVSPWVGKIPWRRAWQPTPLFLPGESPWTEGPGGLQSMGSQRVGHNWATKQQWPQDWKRSIFIPIPKNGSTKECAKHQTVALICLRSCLKSCNLGFSIMWVKNFQTFKLGLGKEEEPEIKLPTSLDHR